MQKNSFICMFAVVVSVLLTCTSYAEPKKSKKHETQAVKPRKVISPLVVDLVDYNIVDKMGIEPTAEMDGVLDSRYGQFHNANIVPKDLSNYKYLSYNSKIAFYILKYNPQKISQISVEGIRRKCIDTYHCGNTQFKNIKGLEELDKQIDSLSNFDIADKKQEIIEKIMRVFESYELEYNQFLNYNKGYYSILEEHGLRSQDQHWKYQTLSKQSNYNYDAKTLSFKYFNDPSIADIYSSMTGINFQITNREGTATIPMPTEQAKKLFGDKEQVICKSLITLKVKPGYYYDSLGSFFTSRFDVVKFTKICYQDDPNTSDPSMIIELKSSPTKMFYK